MGKADDGSGSNGGKAAEVPDTDEGGTARRGESRGLESHPEKPVPDEPSG